MFGNMGDMGKMLEGMQENAAKLKEDLANKTFSVKTGGGLVELSVNGNGEVIDLTIAEEALNDKASLEIMILGAINDANKMVQQNQQSSAMNMLGGMGGNPFGGAK